MTAEFRALGAALKRDLKLAWRQPADLWQALTFAVLVVVLFGIALAGSPNKLAAAGPAILFTTTVLAAFLATARLFADDVEDGTLDQLLVSDSALPMVLAGKVLAFWLVNGLGLTLLGPLLGMLVHLPVPALPTLLAASAITTLGMALLGLLGAALTARLKGGAMLLALIVLPLNVPLLIFGLGAVVAGTQGEPVSAGLALAAAEVLLLCVLVPPAAALGLRATSS